MPSFKVTLPDSPIKMNKTVLANQYSCSQEATSLQSPSEVSKSKSKSEQFSSSSKTTSKASTRKGKKCSTTKAPQDKEKRALSETPEAKMKRRQEEKAKKQQTENKKKSRKEGALSETPEEKKKRREERKEKERKQEELKTRSISVPEAIETRSSEFHKDRRSVFVTVGREANLGQQYEEYQQHHRDETAAPRASIAGYGIVSDTALTKRSIGRNGSSMRDSSVWTDKRCLSSAEMKEEVLDEVNLLRYNVKTLSFQLKSAKETIRQLDDRNARMSDLAVQLVKTEEELEYTTEENKEYSSRVRALEQALILQERELDNVLTVMAKRERDSLEAGQATDSFASDDVDEPFSIRKEILASEKADEQLSIRNELKAIRCELEQEQQERDMAVDKATAVSIQLAELKAEKDESRDQSTESRALIEQSRALMRQQGSATLSTGAIKRGFFWNKNDDKPGVLSNENECIDATEDNTSMSSEASHGWNDMDYHERRSHEEACTELTL
jgi:hypothetical protein